MVAATWALAVPALRSQEGESIQQDQFIIEGADAVTTKQAGPGLTQPIPAGPRFILEWADSMAQAEIEEIPPELPLVLQPRFVLEWVDAIAQRSVATVPAQMSRILQPRFIMEWADAARWGNLAYPVALLCDDTLPVISQFGSQVQGDAAIITWQTDVYANSMLEYGLSPGSYSATVYDQWYAKTHELTVSGLVLGTTYYCRVTSTDRCGNTASTTSGCQWTTAHYLYLPLVIRDN
jgi:hypothetical protein